MAYVCTSCGKHESGIKVYPNGLCQACYNYFRRGGVVNPIPKAGEIVRDYRGYIVCHICGKAYVRLGSHIKESHKMTISEYKEEFGLCESCRTTEEHYSNTMRELAYKNDMPERLKSSGVNTRFKRGERGARYCKKARLQESLDKKARSKKAG